MKNVDEINLWCAKNCTGEYFIKISAEYIYILAGWEVNEERSHQKYKNYVKHKLGQHHPIFYKSKT